MNETPPSSDLQGSYPSGELSLVARCCPMVSTFDGSRQQVKLYGFDARTNLAPKRGEDEYWNPRDASKSAPGDRMTQDGAAWVSVIAGEETEVEISFAGHTSQNCIANSTLEVTPAGIVQIDPTRGTTSGAPLRVRGLSPGEATVKVVCEGKDLGWFHVVCYKAIKIDVSIGCIKTSLTRVVSYSAGELSRILNRVFRAAGIKITLVDVGVADLSGDAEVARIEQGLRTEVPDPYLSDGFGQLQKGQIAFLGDISADGILEDMQKISAEAVPLVGRAQTALWYFVPKDVAPRLSGMAENIPGQEAFVYKDFKDVPANQSGEYKYGIEDSYAVVAHELGHLLGLYHPERGNPGNQFPAHLLVSLGDKVTPEDATNTEPKIVPNDLTRDTKNASIIMQRDPLNLMGYWPAFKDQIFLRKLQWDAARSVAEKRKNEGL